MRFLFGGSRTAGLDSEESLRLMNFSDVVSLGLDELISHVGLILGVVKVLCH